MTQRLEGRRIVVTGGASGIGRAVAHRAAVEGAHVAVFDLPAQLAAVPAGQLPVACDVADAAAVEAAFAVVDEALGGVDGAVAAAGVGSDGSDCVAASLEHWQRLISVNLTGVFLTARAAVPRIAAAGGGALVLVASQLGLVGARRAPAYCASKGGVIALGRALALDHAAAGIRVNAVCPGPVDTPMFAASDGGRDVERLIAERIPARRIGRPDEIAAVVALLLADEAAYLTGAALPVDGGFTAQ
jgi:NAD(P)-dependent dehydrogenase (short-subunit alcohol dehydrogenase family)